MAPTAIQVTLVLCAWQARQVVVARQDLSQARFEQNTKTFFDILTPIPQRETKEKLTSLTEVARYSWWIDCKYSRQEELLLRE